MLIGNDANLKALDRKFNQPSTKFIAPSFSKITKPFTDPLKPSHRLLEILWLKIENHWSILYLITITYKRPWLFACNTCILLFKVLYLE